MFDLGLGQLLSAQVNAQADTIRMKGSLDAYDKVMGPQLAEDQKDRAVARILKMQPLVADQRKVVEELEKKLTAAPANLPLDALQSRFEAESKTLESYLELSLP